MRRLGITHAAVPLLGCSLLVVIALPLASGGSGVGAVDWTPLLVAAAVVGFVGGALQGGLCLMNKNALAVVVAMLAGVAGLIVPLFWAAPPGDGLRTESVDLLAALVGWGLYFVVNIGVLIIAVRLAVDAVGRPGKRRG
jgi:hypothetical protein